MCIWRGALRSFLGHIRILSPTELLVPLCGPATVANPHGPPKPNTRTISRLEYTKMLLDRLPWVDTVDLRIFLIGFDAGEQFASCKVDIEAKTPIVFPSWDVYFVKPSVSQMSADQQ